MTVVARNDGYSAQQGDGTVREAIFVASLATGATAGQTQGNVAAGATDTGNPVKIGGVFNTTIPTYTNGQRSDIQTDNRGSVRIAIADTATGGTSPSLATVRTPTTDGVAANTGVTTYTQTMLFNGTTWDRQAKPNLTSRIASSAASVNATSAKATAGNVFKIFGNNAKASVVYLKIYNKATAPTVGTDVPVLTIPIGASGRFDIDIGGDTGFYLGTGIAYGFTTDAADNGTTALLAADILGFTLTYS